MPDLNLRRVYNLTDKKGEVKSYGPGETEVPDEHVDELKARRALVGDLQPAKSDKSDSAQGASSNAKGEKNT